MLSRRRRRGIYIPATSFQIIMSWSSLIFVSCLRTFSWSLRTFSSSLTTLSWSGVMKLPTRSSSFANFLSNSSSSFANSFSNFLPRRRDKRRINLLSSSDLEDFVTSVGIMHTSNIKQVKCQSQVHKRCWATATGDWNHDYKLLYSCVTVCAGDHDDFVGNKMMI